jgi:hypothetical protein
MLGSNAESWGTEERLEELVVGPWMISMGFGMISAGAGKGSLTQGSGQGCLVHQRIAAECFWSVIVDKHNW